MSGPIFTFGAIGGQVRSAEAAREQAELGYRQTILHAFRDTNDALIGTQKTREGVQFQLARVDALQGFARLSRLKFEGGLVGYVEVLVADNELLAARLALVNLQANRHTQIVNVYRSMGGGWVDIAGARAAARRDIGVTRRQAGPTACASGPEHWGASGKQGSYRCTTTEMQP